MPDFELKRLSTLALGVVAASGVGLDFPEQVADVACNQPGLIDEIGFLDSYLVNDNVVLENGGGLDLDVNPADGESPVRGPAFGIADEKPAQRPVSAQWRNAGAVESHLGLGE